MKVLGNCLSFPKKKQIGAFGLLELEIWAEQLNSVWAAEQIWTSK